MKFVPGPDLPCGGKIVGLDGIRDAYLTGRGSFRTRATARIESITPRRKGIVVTELPYLVGPEKVIEKVKDLVQAKKLAGHRRRQGPHRPRPRPAAGHRGQERLQPRRRPRAALPARRRWRSSFGINNVALVDGPAAHPGPEGAAQGLRRLPHRRRPPPHRAPPRQARGAAAPRRGPAHRDRRHRRGHPGHPQLRRRRHRTRAADGRLRPVRGPGDLHPRPAAAPADQVLADRARDREDRARAARSRSCGPCSSNEKLLREARLDRARRRRQGARHAATHRAARGRVPARTATATSPLEVADDPCWVLLSLDRPARPDRLGASPCTAEGPRSKHDVVIGAVRTTARGEFGLVTSAGRMVRLSALDLPTLPPTNGAPSLSGGAPLAAYVDLGQGRGTRDHRADRRGRTRRGHGHRRRRRQAGHLRGAQEQRLGRHQPQGR